MDEKASSPWIAALACSALIVIAAAGGMVALRTHVLHKAAQMDQPQQEAITRLGARLGEAETQLAALANAPKPDTAPIDALRAELATAHADIAALTARIDQLEKEKIAAPAPPPVSSFPPPGPTLPSPETVLRDKLRLAARSGQPYAKDLEGWEIGYGPVPALHPASTTGLPTDEQLRSQLRTILATLPVADTQPTGFMQQLNTHLQGLVSIHKTASDPTAALRHAIDSADIASLRALVLQLPEANRAPFAGWLATLTARDAVYTALDQLAAPGH